MAALSSPGASYALRPSMVVCKLRPHRMFASRDASREHVRRPRTEESNHSLPLSLASPSAARRPP
eukprot:2432178-Prymnesium_polylepis.2